MDRTSALELALAATRRGVASSKLSARIRREGLAALQENFLSLPTEVQEAVRVEAVEVAEKGVYAVLWGTSEYPGLLRLILNAPVALFCLGRPSLLSAPGVGICGARNVSDDGLRAAAVCGQVAARQGLSAISGYARGVDMVTHAAALNAGGVTVIVLPEGINHFRVKPGEFREAWDTERVLIVSQFAPKQTWSTGNAMTRNSVIIGLSLGLVVVEAGETGGTLAAGMRALELDRQVLTLEFADTPRGNQILLERGAVSVYNKTELASFFDELHYVGEQPNRAKRELHGQYAMISDPRSGPPEAEW